MTRGPVPKRSTERRRRNKTPGLTTAQVSGRVVIPTLPKGTHPIARRWYASLKASGQSQWFEPSDWAGALYVAAVMTKNLNQERFSAQLFGTVWGAMNDLMTTESARRRVRAEVERDAGEPVKDGPTPIDEYRKMVNG